MSDDGSDYGEDPVEDSSDSSSSESSGDNIFISIFLSHYFARNAIAFSLFQLHFHCLIALQSYARNKFLFH